MASYPDHRDQFDEDLGLFTIVTTAGTSVLADSKRTNDQPGDAWLVNGIYYTNAKTAAKGDGIRVVISVNETTAANTYTYFGLYVNATPTLATPATGGMNGAYFYSDGGIVKLHGVAPNGPCGEITLDEEVTAGMELVLVYSWNLTDGKLSATVQGGPWDEPTAFLSENIQGLSQDWSWQCTGYSADSGWSILDYDWYDLGGPGASERSYGPLSGENISIKIGNKIGI